MDMILLIELRRIEIHLPERIVTRTVPFNRTS